MSPFAYDNEQAFICLISFQGLIRTKSGFPLLFLKFISYILSLENLWAASLGQVYKGRLKENGDLVAVKVQRPFVLETVTVDLFVIRNLGLVLRKFPQVMFC